MACIHFTNGRGKGGRGKSEFNRRVRNYFLTERSLKKFFARSRVSGTAAILSANPFVHPVALSINCFRGIRLVSLSLSLSLFLSPLPPCSIPPLAPFRELHSIRSYIVIKPSSTSCSLMSVTLPPFAIRSSNGFPLLFSSPFPRFIPEDRDERTS